LKTFLTTLAGLMFIGLIGCSGNSWEKPGDAPEMVPRDPTQEQQVSFSNESEAVRVSLQQGEVLRVTFEELSRGRQLRISSPYMFILLCGDGMAQERISTLSHSPCRDFNRCEFGTRGSIKTGRIPVDGNARITCEITPYFQNPYGNHSPGEEEAAEHSHNYWDFSDPVEEQEFLFMLEP
jgi:hypothetical protein